eukprot:scaffold301_cov243-Pinguiococcus_pyrenoidosus.AAC.91
MVGKAMRNWVACVCFGSKPGAPRYRRGPSLERHGTRDKCFWLLRLRGVGTCLSSAARTAKEEAGKVVGQTHTVGVLAVPRRFEVPGVFSQATCLDHLRKHTQRAMLLEGKLVRQVHVIPIPNVPVHLRNRHAIHERRQRIVDTDTCVGDPANDALDTRSQLLQNLFLRDVLRIHLLVLQVLASNQTVGALAREAYLVDHDRLRLRLLLGSLRFSRIRGFFRRDHAFCELVHRFESLRLKAALAPPPCDLPAARLRDGSRLQEDQGG